MVAAVELWQPPGCSRLCDVAVHDRNWQLKNDFFTKNRVKTALRVGAGDILFVNENGA